MSIIECENYIAENKNIQNKLLEYMENNENDEKNFDNLQIIFNEYKIHDNKHKLKTILHLIAEIGNNHHRNLTFIEKIEKILTFFKDAIKRIYSNMEIFNIFKNNKRIILLLVEKEIIVIDKNITIKITSEKYLKMNYPQYFAPEIKGFINEKWFPAGASWVEEIKKEIPENFYEKRREGQNDNYICELIRNDLVKEFIIYVTRNNYSLDSNISQSIYETNPFLIQNKIKNSQNNETTLIEYAAFFGSIQIFQNLRFNNVGLRESIWYYAIHGNNPEIIHILEENHVELIENIGFIESIKCHHNDIANYFQNNIMPNNEDYLYCNLRDSLKYFNFSFISIDLIKQNSLLQLCKYDYYYILVDFMINSMKDMYINLSIRNYII